MRTKSSNLIGLVYFKRKNELRNRLDSKLEAVFNPGIGFSENLTRSEKIDQKF